MATGFIFRRMEMKLNFGKILEPLLELSEEELGELSRAEQLLLITIIEANKEAGYFSSKLNERLNILNNLVYGKREVKENEVE